MPLKRKWKCVRKVKVKVKVRISVNWKSIWMQNQYWRALKTDERSKSWHGRVGGKVKLISIETESTMYLHKMENQLRCKTNMVSTKDGWALKKLTWESWGKRPLLTFSWCQQEIDGRKSPKHSRKWNLNVKTETFNLYSGFLKASFGKVIGNCCKNIQKNLNLNRRPGHYTFETKSLNLRPYWLS